MHVTVQERSASRSPCSLRTMAPTASCAIISYTPAGSLLNSEQTSTMDPSSLPQATEDKLLEIPLSYQNERSEESALALVFSLRPEWEHSDGAVDIVRFKDGITNTVGLWARKAYNWDKTEASNSF